MSKNNLKTKVSIILPICNDFNDAEETVASIVSQSYSNIEIIIVNCGYGTRENKEILEHYGDRIRYYNHESSTLSSALNYGIEKAKGIYFCWLTTGCRYDTNAISNLVKMIDDTEKRIIVSGWAIINENGLIDSEYRISKIAENNFKAFLAFSDEAKSLNTSSMLFPVKEFKKYAKFSENQLARTHINQLNNLAESGITCAVDNNLTLFCTTNNLYYPQSYDSMTNNDLDFTISEIIEELEYKDILNYFNGLEGALAYYEGLLPSKFYRSKAMFIKKIVEGQLQAEDEAAQSSIASFLSMLPVEQLGVDIDNLINKIKNPSKRKKIMFSTAHWLTGGIERVISTLFNELSNKYEIFLITPYDVRESKIEIPNYVTSIKISNEAFAYNFDSVLLAYALLLDIDVIIGNTNMFERQLNLYNICVGTKIKTIASNHEYYFYPYKSEHFYNVVEKRLSAFKRADAIIWPNNFSAALCGEYIDSSYVIGNPNKFSISDGSCATENIILCVGRFNDYVKRIDRIFESFSIILKNVPDAKLVLVGKYDFDAPIEDSEGVTIKGLIERFNIPHNSYRFTGEVDNVQDYYSQAKVLMLTSNSEGFGMVLTEAASFGVPAVANYIPGIEDIIIEGKNGYITELGDVEGMALRVCEILSSNTIWKNLSQGALSHVRSFDSKNIGKKWIYLIDTLLQTDREDELYRKLQQKIGYNILDKHKYTKVLANELNEIFYLLVNNSSIQKAKLDELNALKSNSQTSQASGRGDVYARAIGLPKRIKANIEYEGVSRTGKKIAYRSYRIVRRKINK
jgi:glycosyltransferase involved in cell wall biosynthesis